jgi:hypothetical protein
MTLPSWRTTTTTPHTPQPSTPSLRVHHFISPLGQVQLHISLHLSRFFTPNHRHVFSPPSNLLYPSLVRVAGLSSCPFMSCKIPVSLVKLSGGFLVWYAQVVKHTSPLFSSYVVHVLMHVMCYNKYHTTCTIIFVCWCSAALVEHHFIAYHTQHSPAHPFDDLCIYNRAHLSHNSHCAIHDCRNQRWRQATRKTA